MALVSQTPKAVIERQHKMLEMLEKKCSDCELFKGLTPELEYIYTFHDVESCSKGDRPMLAIAQYNSCGAYAVYSQGEMTQRQLNTYELFLRDVKKYAEPGEKIVVFSEESYDFTKKYIGDKPINVILHA